MRYQGKLRQWNDAKGYGFVEPNGGGDTAFVHIKSFVDRSSRPVDGDLIVYKVSKEKDGRLRAVDVTFAENGSNSATVTKRRKKGAKVKIGAALTIGFCLFVSMATLLEEFPWQVLAVYSCASLLAFAAYALDKSAAQHNRWRTRESTLHLFALIGGWPGAYYAQNKLRHKSSKREFKIVFWITVALNIGVTVWLFAGSGAGFVEAIFMEQVIGTQRRF